VDTLLTFEKKNGIKSKINKLKINFSVSLLT